MPIDEFEQERMQEENPQYYSEEAREKHSNAILYMATLTESDGLTAEQERKAKAYMSTLDYCFANMEQGKNGTNPHIHAIIKSNKKGNLLRREILKHVYDKSSRDKVDPHLVRVEKVKDQDAAITYVAKDMATSADNKILPFVLKGFQESFISQSVKDRFVKTRFYTKWKYVKVDQAPGCIIEYCKLKNITISNKDDFVKIVVELSKSNINTRMWRKDAEWIYSQVMSHYGDDSAMELMWHNLLNFL